MLGIIRSGIAIGFVGRSVRVKRMREVEVVKFHNCYKLLERKEVEIWVDNLGAKATYLYRELGILPELSKSRVVHNSAVPLP